MAKNDIFQLGLPWVSPKDMFLHHIKSFPAKKKAILKIFYFLFVLLKSASYYTVQWDTNSRISAII